MVSPIGLLYFDSSLSSSLLSPMWFVAKLKNLYDSHLLLIQESLLKLQPLSVACRRRRLRCRCHLCGMAFEA